MAHINHLNTGTVIIFSSVTGTSDDESVPEVNSTSVVFANISKVESKDADYLCIYELQAKLKKSGEHFDIGGTYSDSSQELWFYFSTTICAGANHLLNLFVCHRKVGNLEISVPTKYNLSCAVPDKAAAQMKTYTFHTTQPDEHHYIKTYSFRQKDLEGSKNITKHYIPIDLKTGKDRRIDPEILKIIKLNHDIGSLIQKEKPDITLISSSGAEYNTHRIVLQAHSAILREKLADPVPQSLRVDVTDKEMEVLLDFMYTGTVKDIAKQDKVKLKVLGEKFHLSNITALAVAEQ